MPSRVAGSSSSRRRPGSSPARRSPGSARSPAPSSSSPGRPTFRRPSSSPGRFERDRERAQTGRVNGPAADRYPALTGSRRAADHRVMTELGLTPLPPLTALAVRWVNRSLKVLNRWFMVPAHRLGLGPWIGTPIGGYILLLRVRGRRSGVIRETPLSYLIQDGSAWVLAGFGTRTEWYRNLLVDPGVEIWLPGRVMRCRAEEVTDPAIRDPLLPRLVRAAGGPGLLVG